MPSSTLCPNCESPLATKFCPGCGQKAIAEDDLTLRRGWSHFAHELWHLDGRLSTTLKGIFLRPGQATLDFLEGRRARHMHPLQIFLLISGLHFLILQQGFLAGVLESMAQWRRGDLLSDRVALSEGVRQHLPHFESTVKLLDYASLFLLALLLLALYRKRWPHYGHHLVFLAHRACWNFGVVTLWLPLESRLITHFPTRMPMINLLTALPYLAFQGYTYLALRRVYTLAPSAAALGTFLLTVAGILLTVASYALAFQWVMP